MAVNITDSRFSAGITGSTLKIIAVISMFFDHVGAALLEAYLTSSTVISQWDGSMQLKEWLIQNPATRKIYYIDLILRCIGRFAFPIFAFMLVEGFTHTSNILKYARNLAIFCLISEMPFDLAFYHKLITFSHQNVYFTLLLGLLALWIIRFFEEAEKLPTVLAPVSYVTSFLSGAFICYFLMNGLVGDILKDYMEINMSSPIAVGLFVAFGIISCVIYIIRSVGASDLLRTRIALGSISVMIVALLGDLLHTDYGTYGVLTVVIIYLLRADKTAAFSLGVLVLTLMEPIEACAMAMISVVKNYNGQRGNGKKYFFYSFYPAHLLLLYLLAFLLGFSKFSIM